MEKYAEAVSLGSFTVFGADEAAQDVPGFAEAYLCYANFTELVAVRAFLYHG